MPGKWRDMAYKTFLSRSTEKLIGRFNWIVSLQSQGLVGFFRVYCKNTVEGFIILRYMYIEFIDMLL